MRVKVWSEGVVRQITHGRVRQSEARAPACSPASVLHIAPALDSSSRQQGAGKAFAAGDLRVRAAKHSGRAGRIGEAVAVLVCEVARADCGAIPPATAEEAHRQAVTLQ